MAATAKTYLSCKETAVLVRQALKRAFPTVTFGVTSKTYAGGASITVSWTDGPLTKAVDKAISGFEGAGFDGMIDLKYPVTSWLKADGSAGVAHIDGTNGSQPEVSNPIPEGATLVQFGADFVHTNRHITDFDSKQAEALGIIEARCKLEGEGAYRQFGNEWVNDLASRMVWAKAEGEDWEPSFQRAILRKDV